MALRFATQSLWLNEVCMRGRFFSRVAALLIPVVLAAAIAAAGCGTILYPERRGQPAGRLDFKVVALDAIGMLFFFVPGVVAFAVDFATGAIYLPPEPYVIGYESGRLPPVQEWVKVEVAPSKLDKIEIERTVGEHAGCPVNLAAGAYRACAIDELHDADNAFVKLAAAGHSYADVNFQRSGR
jgi:hypothetical protein